jgi:hypothetical protein
VAQNQAILESSPVLATLIEKIALGSITAVFDGVRFHRKAVCTGSETSFLCVKRILMTSTTSAHTASTNNSFTLGSVKASGFVDRRSSGNDSVGRERRQFGSSHAGLSADGRELALAIDAYKVQNHRRYITCDEMLGVLTKLGYQKVH